MLSTQIIRLHRLKHLKAIELQLPIAYTSPSLSLPSSSIPYLPFWLNMLGSSFTSTTAEAEDINITVQETKEANSIDIEHRDVNRELSTSQSRNYKRWLRVLIYTVFVLSGQAIGNLLGRQYFDKGGKSKWMATLVQLAGFPILLPCYFFPPINISTTTNNHMKPPSNLILGSIYFSIGLLVAANCYLYSVGLMYLPVSTYSLICASQLAFNVFFAYFLNAQKFTPFIVNSLVLLTISSTLLVFQKDAENPIGVSKGKYIIGFVCTLGASAMYGLQLSVTQLVYQKIITRQTFSAVMDMVIYECLVASSAILVGFFVSGEWKNIKTEAEDYKLGKVSYAMNLLWTAIFWQAYGVGCVGLIFEVSSLFSNAISVLGLPLVPILAVIFFHDKMDGLKIISMVLGIWGFVSYAYQNYIEDCNLKIKNNDANGVHKATATESSKD